MTGPAKNFVDTLRRRAEREGGRAAFTFLAYGEERESRFTYDELDRSAREIAAHLQAIGAAGERAILLYPSGLDFIAAFFGCLYARTIAVPVYPPDPARLQRTLPRLLGIVADAQASIVLTTSRLLAMAEALFERAPLLAGKRWIATDQRSASPDDWTPTSVASEDLAFLQYTSGSTGTPRGVMVTHGNVVANCAHAVRAFRLAPDTVAVHWLPLYHDMGLVSSILTPVSIGCPSVLMSPIDFLAKPVRWLEAIGKYGGHGAGGPNFAYDLCARKVARDEAASLDLRSWKVAHNGAEPIRVATIERFSETFAASGFSRSAFQPCYGLAEATVLVTAADYGAEPTVRMVDRRALGERCVRTVDPGPDALELVSCGSAVEQQVIVVDPETGLECGCDAVGEIWLRGDNVSAGYWNRPDDASFRGRVPSRRGTFLRTGDLGFTSGGELFVIGRSKDLVIIRGVNHYPQDIEATVEASWYALRRGCSAAFSVEVDGEEQLVIVTEVERRHQADRPVGAGGSVDVVFDAVRRAVIEHHEVSVHAVVLLVAGTIPKTSSGKIQRHACRTAFLEGSLEEIARHTVTRTEVTTQRRIDARDVRTASGAERTSLLTTYLRQSLAALLETDPRNIDTHRPVNTYGIDSLRAVELNYQLEQDLGVAMPFSIFLRAVTIASLAALVSDRMDEGADAPPIVAAPRDRPTPLSYSQESFWNWEQRHVGTATWNLPRFCRLVGKLDVAALERAWAETVRRNEILRTRFVAVDGRPAMTVDPSGVDLALDELRGNEPHDRQIAAIAAADSLTPFDLRGQLVRARVLRLRVDEHILFLTMHHLLIDALGWQQLCEDLMTVYEAFARGEPSPLEELPFQFADYAAWHRKWCCPEALTARVEYWRRQLAGARPTVLPTDARTGSGGAARSYHRSLKVPAERTAALEEVGRRGGATLYMTLLAALATLLRRYCPQDEIVVSSATANRSVRPELKRMVANFAESLVFRLDVSGNLTFRAVLERVRGATLDAYENGDLAAQFILDTDNPFGHPLLGVRLNLQPPFEPRAATTLRIRPAATGFEMMEHVVDPYPLEIGFAQSSEGLDGWLTSSSGVFESTTVDRIARDYLALLDSVAANPDQEV
jgi:acyl-CoA synthetase (AMP-forming)/AMP-acid ligase II/acyl carrier protein